MSVRTDELVRPHEVGTGVFGQRILRLEDPRLLTGAGRYTDDLMPEAAAAAFVRSQYPHARIRDIDVSGALDVQGVLAIYTYEDLDGVFAQPLPLLPSPALIEARTQYALAKEEVCYVGEIVAMVVARDRYLAEDAAQAIVVDYEVLPSVGDLAAAAAPGAPVVHADMADNLAARHGEEAGDVETALAAAPHVYELHLEVERSASHPMEGRAVAATYDPAERRLLVYDSTQAPIGIKAGLAALFELPIDAVHVVAPDIGGGFGVKAAQFYAEEILVPWAAVRLERPVKWTEDRREHFIGSNHERKQIHEVRVGVDDEGRILALDTRYVHDAGAYVPYGLIVPTVTASHLPGPYRIPNYRFEFRAIFTNTLPVSPYRGAGRPQATFVMERVLDHVAKALGLDRAQVRRVNFLQPEDFPYTVGVTAQDGNVVTYDSGDYPRAFEQLIDALGYAKFRRAKDWARKEGRFLGLGIGCYVEQTGIGPYEGAVVEIMPDGTVTVATGLSSQGQAHETVFAQIAADELGVAVERVKVRGGDTRRITFGVGTFASRAAVVAGNAVLLACREVRKQAARVASRPLQVDPDDLVFAGGRVFSELDPGRSITLAQIVTLSNPLRYAFNDQGDIEQVLAWRAAARSKRPLDEGTHPGLRAEEYFSPRSGVFAFGMHGVVLEVDPDTFDIRFHRYVVMHDCGRVINPMVVEGQVYGGVAQGVGGAFYERIAYDEDGQLQNANFMDFLIPYATEVPAVEIHHMETPSPWNPLGIKGAGEGGVIPAAAAVAGALEDALGVTIDRMPLSPMDLFELASALPA